MARTDLGRTPAALDLLLSPSRGLLDGGGDEASLRNPAVQERFRDHIADKLARWASTRHEARSRRMQELGTILLDFRKLREGITSIRRVDGFACKAYEASVLLAVYSGNDPQLSSSLPHLVQALHPAVLLDPTATSVGLDVALSQLSLSSAGPPDPDTRAFFISLHLLHTFLLPSFASSSTPATPSSARPALSSLLPTLFSLLKASTLPLPSALYPRPAHTSAHITHLLLLYHALSRLSAPALATLFSPAALPPLPSRLGTLLRSLHLPPSFHPTAVLLAGAVPCVRARLWDVKRRAYRFPPDPTAWVARGLLFEVEAEAEERERAEEDAAVAKGVRVPAAGREDGNGGGEIRGSWEDEDEADADVGSRTTALERERSVRAEAERRAEVWVKERLTVAG